VIVGDTGILASVDIPGVKAESLEVEIENGTITARGYRADRPTHEVFESYVIGNDYDATKAEATLEDGVLKVVVPKHSDKIVKHRVPVRKK
jgi:HSP20 family molecular chaperone IbpA